VEEADAGRPSVDGEKRKAGLGQAAGRTSPLKSRGGGRTRWRGWLARRAKSREERASSPRVRGAGRPRAARGLRARRQREHRAPWPTADARGSVVESLRRQPQGGATRPPNIGRGKPGLTEHQGHRGGRSSSANSVEWLRPDRRSHARHVSAIRRPSEPARPRASTRRRTGSARPGTRTPGRGRVDEGRARGRARRDSGGACSTAHAVPGPANKRSAADDRGPSAQRIASVVEEKGLGRKGLGSRPTENGVICTNANHRAAGELRRGPRWKRRIEMSAALRPTRSDERGPGARCLRRKDEGRSRDRSPTRASTEAAWFWTIPANRTTTRGRLERHSRSEFVATASANELRSPADLGSNGLSEAAPRADQEASPRPPRLRKRRYIILHPNAWSKPDLDQTGPARTVAPHRKTGTDWRSRPPPTDVRRQSLRDVTELPSWAHDSYRARPGPRARSSRTDLPPVLEWPNAARMPPDPQQNLLTNDTLQNQRAGGSLNRSAGAGGGATPRMEGRHWESGPSRSTTHRDGLKERGKLENASNASNRGGQGADAKTGQGLGPEHSVCKQRKSLGQA